MTFNEVMESQKQLDVLLIPGGSGTLASMETEIAFVKTIFPKTRALRPLHWSLSARSAKQVKYVLTICTGATIAARTGTLDGRKAITNKYAWDWATLTGPNVDWQRTARWVVDGDVWTSPGVSAGIDMTLAWVGHVYGETVAEYGGTHDGIQAFGELDE